MAKKPRIDRGATAREVEDKAVVKMWGQFEDKTRKEIRKLVKNQEIAQWDDPAALDLLESDLRNLGDGDLTPENLIKMAALAAILENFE